MENIKKKEVGKKSPKNQGDYLTRLILIQCLVCALVFSGVFALCKTNDKTYSQMKISFSEMMKHGYSTKDVAQRLKSVGQMVFLPMETVPEENESTTEEKTTEKEEIITEIKNENLNTKSISYTADSLKNSMCLPVAGRWSSYFGERTNPVTGIYSFHSGLDIAASEGERIRAALDGKIRIADYTEANGNYIIMEHGNTTTAYCHCSKLLVKKGDVIRKGETIALVGSTGNSTGPHLHFEIKVDGKLIDPASVFEMNEA
ncbi:MAG: M23 family metallopeptidase [Clostridia bacterium]|nr:M23 family metallopeptidase [Clostridia bacterium]